MALDYHRLKAARLAPIEEQLTADKCILYALGVGAQLGDAQQAERELALVYEEQLEILPAMACVVGYAGFWMRDPQYGLDWQRVVHAEQRMRFHAPLASCTSVTGSTHVQGIVDKGIGKGAVVVIERQLHAAGGELLCTMEQLNYCRGDGGYAGSDAALSDAMPAALARPPGHEPDVLVSLRSSRHQAAIYRLLGDRNPLHVDAGAARQAGFPNPIMHGAAALGMVNRALRLAFGPGQHLAQLDIRFTGVFFPGETLRVEIWRTGLSAAYRCCVSERSVEIAYGSATWTEEQ